MNWSVLLTLLPVLVGLILELAGAFLLAVEAIGIDRIRDWRRLGAERASWVLEPKKTGMMARRSLEARLRWLPTILVGTASGLGAYAGGGLALFVKQHAGPAWLSILAGLAGITVGAFFIDAVVLVLRGITFLLGSVEASAERRTIGISGFFFLAVGIALQVFGVFVEFYRQLSGH